MLAAGPLMLRLASGFAAGLFARSSTGVCLSCALMLCVAPHGSVSGRVARCDSRLKPAWSNIAWMTNSAHFAVSIRSQIELPLHLRPQHHLLFTFYNVGACCFAHCIAVRRVSLVASGAILCICAWLRAICCRSHPLYDCHRLGVVLACSSCCC
jgi:hypothetical protein